jgi:hypothetical protein
MEAQAIAETPQSGQGAGLVLQLTEAKFVNARATRTCGYGSYFSP